LRVTEILHGAIDIALDQATAKSSDQLLGHICQCTIELGTHHRQIIGVEMLIPSDYGTIVRSEDADQTEIVLERKILTGFGSRGIAKAGLVPANDFAQRQTDGTAVAWLEVTNANVASRPRIGDDLQVLSGLAAGDQVVTGANFLVDSESSLRAALQGFQSPPAGER